MFQIIGIVLLFAMVFGSYLMAGGNMTVILHSLPHELMCIFGAAIAAFLIGNKVSTIKGTLGGFGRIFGGPKFKAQDYRDLLTLLYLLTIADSRATGPSAWSNWKAGLVAELYLGVKTYLAAGGAAGDDHGESAGVRWLREQVVARLAGRTAAIDLATLPADYLLGFSPEEVVRHLGIHQARIQFKCLQVGHQRLLMTPQPGTGFHDAFGGEREVDRILVFDALPGRQGVLVPSLRHADVAPDQAGAHAARIDRERRSDVSFGLAQGRARERTRGKLAVKVRHLGSPHQTLLIR